MQIIAITAGVVFAAAVWRHAKSLRLIGAAVSGLIAFGMLSPSVHSTSAQSTPGGLIVLAAAAAGLGIPPSRAGRRVLILCIPIAAIIAVGGWVLTPIIAALLVWAWRLGTDRDGYPTGQVVGRRAQMTAAQLGTAREFGVPGGISDATDVFGAFALIGAEGERVVADYLSQLLPTSYGAYLFHGCDWPRIDYDADIDHVWLGEGCIVLIDAKNWAAGTYVTNVDGTVSRDGKLFEPASKNSMQIAVALIEEFTGIPTSAVTALVTPCDIRRLHPNGGVPFVNLDDVKFYLPTGAPATSVLQRMSSLLRVQQPTRATTPVTPTVILPPPPAVPIAPLGMTPPPPAAPIAPLGITLPPPAPLPNHVTAPQLLNHWAPPSPGQ